MKFKEQQNVLYSLINGLYTVLYVMCITDALINFKRKIHNFLSDENIFIYKFQTLFPFSSNRILCEQKKH